MKPLNAGSGKHITDRNEEDARGRCYRRSGELMADLRSQIEHHRIDRREDDLTKMMEEILVLME
jgi:hypothetical protein